MTESARLVQAFSDKIAGYAEEVRTLLLDGRADAIGPWLDKNFDRRRSLYAISPPNVDLVERARSAGAHCKFAGSGGAIVGTYGDDACFHRIEAAFSGTETVVLKPRYAPEP